jgi:hypothetical protein
MIIYSKRLDALARATIVESFWLDEQETPQRNIERHKMKDDEDRVQQEKAPPTRLARADLCRSGIFDYLSPITSANFTIILFKPVQYWTETYPKSAYHSKCNPESGEDIRHWRDMYGGEDAEGI